MDSRSFSIFISSTVAKKSAKFFRWLSKAGKKSFSFLYDSDFPRIWLLPVKITWIPRKDKRIMNHFRNDLTCSDTSMACTKIPRVHTAIFECLFSLLF